EIADRAGNKSVGKRARAMVQAIDDAAAAKKAALEQHQQRVAAALSRIEALAAAPGAACTAEQIEDAERQWHEMVNAATHDIAEGERSRFDSAAATARAGVEREARE